MAWVGDTGGLSGLEETEGDWGISYFLHTHFSSAGLQLQPAHRLVSLTGTLQYIQVLRVPRR